MSAGLLTPAQHLAVCARVDARLRAKGIRGRCTNLAPAGCRVMWVGYGYEAETRGCYSDVRVFEIAPRTYTAVHDLSPPFLGCPAWLARLIARWTRRDWIWVQAADLTLYIEGRWPRSTPALMRDMMGGHRFIDAEILRLAIPESGPEEAGPDVAE